MLKLLLSCTNCGYTSEVEDVYNLDGCCPNCHEHHGEVHYLSRMTSDQFIEELAKMSEEEISKCVLAIKYCAENISEEHL